MSSKLYLQSPRRLSAGPLGQRHHFHAKLVEQMIRVSIRFILSCFFIVSLLLCPLDIAAQDNNVQDWRRFLENLSGSWDLTATMGSQNLYQRCEGEWILQRNFFRMSCKAIPPDTSGYQALYLIGYQSEEDHYVFHLFDVFGGDYSETLGIGRLENDRIPFQFNYPQGLFQNIFVWNKEEQSWEMILRQRNEEGSWELFSQKVLTKVN